MALINCKECKKEISNTVKACPSCGAKVGMGFFKKCAVGLFGFWMFGTIVGQLGRDSSPKPPAPVISPKETAVAAKLQAEQDEIKEVRRACNNFVKESLHDPDSADLPSSYDLPFQKLKNGYLVQISGRAKNGFGAIRKMTIHCTAKKDATGWRLSTKQIE